ncbi:MAG: MOSC domain-containing protein [Vitreoscilla sp.]|nr:MOSC domain-containing protein [Vitreoscilla sp.]
MQILSVNTAAARAIHINGREVMTAIGKQPRSGPVACGPMGLEGDEQADLSVHGGLSKAVYAYPAEHLAFWRTVRAQARASGWDDEMRPGAVGENLTVSGVNERSLWIGDRLCLAGGVVLAVSEPRFPCFKFNAAMGFSKAAKLMVESGYCGAYLAVVEPGVVQAGEAFTLLPGPREVGLLELFRARTAGKSF